MAFAANIEQWRLIDEYQNYEISSHGRVRNNKTNRILKNGKDKDGYSCLTLRKEGKGKFHYVHRLVAFSFCENPENLDLVDHIDRVKTNNIFNNLRWVTPSINRKNTGITTRNTSGVQGVSLDRNYWRATWSDIEGHRGFKTFSIDTYGDEQAKQMAIAYRKQKEAEFGYLN